MLILEGILINVFETPRGYKGRQRIWWRIKDSGHVWKQASKRRNSHGDGDFNCYRYFPYLDKIKSAVRVPVALNVYQGKAYLKAVCWWRRRRDGRRKTPAFRHRFGAVLPLITWYMDLNRLFLAGRGFPRGRGFEKQGKFTWVMGKKKPVFWELGGRRKRTWYWEPRQRLQRYAGAKSRALCMANYIKTEDVSNNENRKLVRKLSDCASYLVFKHYYTENKVILHGMKTCRQQLLCPFCALRRAAKHVRAYWDKVATVKAENPELQLYFVTLTVKDGASLQRAV